MSGHDNCPNCGAPWSAFDSKCPYCGTENQKVLQMDFSQPVTVSITATDGLRYTMRILPTAFKLDTECDYTDFYSADGLAHYTMVSSVASFVNLTGKLVPLDDSMERGRELYVIEKFS